VHHAADKCAFIRANCPDEEAGLFSYLSLYYCGLGNAQPLAFVIMALWLALLFTTIGIAASDFFCINLSTIASILGMSESMAGVTFLAFGNGSPDVFSTFAAMSSNSGSLAIGELIGAAGFITAVVAGSMALVREFKVGKKTFVRDVGFFIVAASFSMIFLADGALHLWECCVMIGFYVFYVATVVVWHWYLSNRRKWRTREAAARGHYLSVTNEETEVAEEDEDDEDAPTGQRGYGDPEDFAALERGPSPGLGLDGLDGDEGMLLQVEMASSMRVTRPAGSRRNTITPIRPSLVGALEFRSVLSTLQKARGSYSKPIHLRRYSDDPGASLNQLDGPSHEPAPYSDDPDVVVTRPDDFSGSPPRADESSRGRAVSMNDAESSRPMNPAAFSVAHVPEIGVVGAKPTFPRHLHVPGDGASNSIMLPGPPSPSLRVTPPVSNNGASRDVSPAPSSERWKFDTSLEPGEGIPGARHLGVLKPTEHVPLSSPKPTRPNIRAKATQRPHLHIPNSSRDSSRSRTLSPVLQFPAYTDSPRPISSPRSNAPSFILPNSEFSPESIYPSDNSREQKQRPIPWWPYRFAPSPHILASALFPTLCTWSDKSIWDKFVSVVSAPSIFLLAITLPVVEAESEPEKEALITDEDRRTTTRARSGTVPRLNPDSPTLEGPEPEWIRYRRATETGASSRSPNRGLTGHSTAQVAISTEHIHHHPQADPHLEPPPPLHMSEGDGQDWNRWLVSVQIFTAPLFVVTIIWANTDEGNMRSFIKLILYSLLASVIVFGILVLTTTPARPPKYRFLLCFLGFIVSIAWISTIANEVVGVLKAFGVILGISDAILGLTIFAVGNSLGDLVADITVARLGYPVMALSACFGGPMLNILLGVGISGMYMTVTQANHKHEKHPGKAIKYKPYEIEVSGTLLISGLTLLVTLVGLLIFVPLNKWIMSRRIGYGLIALWCVSTVVNLAVEFSGAWGDTASVSLS
jgi:sodium/potassium/calcium exchanger 6